MDGGSLVREARLRAGLTQAQLAARAGTTQSALARLETGRASPSFARVVALVEACGLDLRVGLDEAPEPEPRREHPAGSWPVTSEILSPLLAAGVAFVIGGRLAAALRGADLEAGVPLVVPDDGRANLEALGEALGALHARVRVEDGSLPLVRAPDALRPRRRWELVTPHGPIDVDLEPAGTRGYRDLSRDASVVEVGGLARPGAAVRAPGRHLEAAHDPVVHRLRRLIGPSGARAGEQAEWLVRRRDPRSGGD
jgi:transcriptional regulator with XRE-family HTH domain